MSVTQASFGRVGAKVWLKPLCPPEDEDFHDMIADRYERTSTILTSNLHFEG